jgi:glycosyltransferase involved in cell wall biosynthesis
MSAPAYSRLVMLGAAPETLGSTAAVVECYRAHGLFKRWSIDYLPTHRDAGASRNLGLALDTLRRFAWLLAQHGRMPVHLHMCARGSPVAEAALAAAALAARCPLLLQLHGAGLERAHGSALMRQLLGRAACVLVPCESLHAWVRRVARGAHVVCLPTPVTCDAPASAGVTSETVRPLRQNLVLFLGRLEPAKGIFDLLEAVAAVRATVPDVRLVCAGDGDRLGVAQHAECLGIADAVKFTGWVGPSGKRALFEAATVFALPSYNEALPVSLLEAMAAGVPVVAAGVGGIPEVVTHDVSGLLVAPGDKASLERALRRLLTERGLAVRIGAAARETARLRFAPERALPKLEEIYAALGVQATAAAVPSPVVDLRRAA